MRFARFAVFALVAMLSICMPCLAASLPGPEPDQVAAAPDAGPSPWVVVLGAAAGLAAFPVAVTAFRVFNLENTQAPGWYGDYQSEAEATAAVDMEKKAHPGRPWKVEPVELSPERYAALKPQATAPGTAPDVSALVAAAVAKALADYQAKVANPSPPPVG